MEMNLLDDDGWMPRISPPEHPGFEWRRKRLAGEHLGASLYALPPGQATWPYHYELGNDELLVVITGSPTLRFPEGERELKPGDCIHLPSGERRDRRASSDQPVSRRGADSACLELRHAPCCRTDRQSEDDDPLGSPTRRESVVSARLGC
jgi:mannose-6-phosphate isomerase-like protein (cupin superfamily)